MGGRGFSGTRLVLVLVLVGAIYMIGKVVTPAPPGPPVEVAKPAVGATAKTPADMKQHMMEEQRDRMKMMQARMKGAQHGKTMQKIDPLVDPTNMDIRPDYFYHTKSGAEGLQEVDARIAKGQAIQDANKKAMAASAPPTSPAPGAAPVVPSK
jgi:hypothetical protein